MSEFVQGGLLGSAATFLWVAAGAWAWRDLMRRQIRRSVLEGGDTREKVNRMTLPELRVRIAEMRECGFDDHDSAGSLILSGIANIIRPGEPWTADDVRAVLAQGDAK